LQAIYSSEKQDKNRAWKNLKDYKNQFNSELTKLVRKAASDVDRLKLVALITIEVHQRDIIE
jgi:dynein heavy chain